MFLLEILEGNQMNYKTLGQILYIPYYLYLTIMHLLDLNFEYFY